MPIEVVRPALGEIVELTGEEAVLVHAPRVTEVDIYGRENTLIASRIDRLNFIDGPDRNAIYAERIGEINAINTTLFNSSLTIDVLGRIGAIEADNQIRLELSAAQANALDIDILRDSQVSIATLRSGKITQARESTSMEIGTVEKTLSLYDSFDFSLNIETAHRLRIIDMPSQAEETQSISVIGTLRTGLFELRNVDMTIDHLTQKISGSILWGSTVRIEDARSAQISVEMDFDTSLRIGDFSNGTMEIGLGEYSSISIDEADGATIQISNGSNEEDSRLIVGNGSVTMRLINVGAAVTVDSGDGDDTWVMRNSEAIYAPGAGEDVLRISGAGNINEGTSGNLVDGEADTILFIARAGGQHQIDADDMDSVLIRSGGRTRAAQEFDTDNDGLVTIGDFSLTFDLV